jgi:hypothetical protein
MIKSRYVKFLLANHGCMYGTQYHVQKIYITKLEYFIFILFELIQFMKGRYSY